MKRTPFLAALLVWLLAACSTPTQPPVVEPDADVSTVMASGATAVTGEVVRITVQLMDSEGEPLAKSGVAVAFYSTAGTLGSGTPTTAGAMVGPLVVRTNANGAAGANLTSGPGAVTVSAYLGQDDSGPKIGDVVVTFASDEDTDDEDRGDEEPKAPSAATSTLTASSLKATTGASVTLTVQLHDEDGEPLVEAGHQVTFATSEGQLTSEGLALSDIASDPLTVETDAGGAAVVRLTSPLDAEVEVTAYLGGSTAAPQVGSVTVTFASIVMDDVVVTYDGQPKTITAVFSDPAAAEGAVYVYGGQASAGLLNDAPRDAGVYVVTVIAGGGFPGTATATLTIEPRQVGLATLEFADKAYDGTPTAPVTVALDEATLVDGDDVYVEADAAGEFQVLDGDEWVPASRAGGYGNDSGSRVVASLSLAGADAHNYVLPELPAGAAVIEPFGLWVANATAGDKTYDGTTAVEFGGVLSPSPFLGDDVGLTARFGSADAGDAVPVLFGLVGDDAANYVLGDPDVTAAIAPRAVTVTAANASKTYGEAAVLDQTAFTVAGLLDGQSLVSVTVTSAGAAADADAGEYEIVASDAQAADGTRLANYQVTYVAGTLAVEPRTLTVSPLGSQGKAYGAADPELLFTVAGLVDGDSVVGALSREEGEDVGRYEYALGTLSVDDGNDGDNYVLELAGEETFQVAARSLVVTPNAGQGKTYGDLEPAFSFTVTSGELAGDDAFVGALGREDGDAVGSYAFTLGTLAVDDGNGGANYSLSLGGDETFSITAREVTIGGSFTVATRPYDGTASASVASNALVVVGALEGDDVAVSPVAEFADGLVGSGKAVALTGDTTLVGEDAGNYALDMTGAPASTGEIVRAPVAFDVANKNSLTYTGSPLGLVIVSDVAPVPADQPVAYEINYRRVATPSGQEVDEGVGSVKEAGLYRVTITSTDDRYVGQNDVLVPVSARPITVAAASSSKVYGEADPDLSPALVSGSLAAGHGLSGQLTYTGEGTGSYDLALGTVAVKAGATDHTANYAITIAGGFTVQPAPVSFDIGNANTKRDGVHVFFADGESVLGLEVLSTPAGMNDYVLSYRRTHDELFAPVPAGRQTVSSISAFGTYAVTISSSNPNYQGTSVRTVWVTDGIALGAPTLGDQGEPVAVRVQLGEQKLVTIPFLGANGEPRALGPVPITFDLTVSPSAGFLFLDPVTLEPITSVTAVPGATALSFLVVPQTLADGPFEVSLALDGWSDEPETILSFDVQPEAVLTVTGSGLEVGQDAISAPINVSLTDLSLVNVAAPVDVTLDLVSEGLVFYDDLGAEVITSVTIPAGSSSATFRVMSSSTGQVQYAIQNGVGVAGIVDAYLGSVTVNPKPSIDQVSLSGAQVGDLLGFEVYGASFQDGATVTFGHPGLGVGGITVYSDGVLAATLWVQVGVPAGSYDLVVTNPDGGTVTVTGALEVALPTLTANDDGPYDIVEGGSTQLSIAGLRVNDVYSSAFLVWDFGGIVTTHGVSVTRNGDTLNVASTGQREDGAWFTYRVVDELGTESEATVTFDVTLPPVDAIVFDDVDEFNRFILSSYEPPTFQEVFNSWPRASSASYFENPASASGAAAAWVYDSGLGSIRQPQNTTTHEMVVSPLSDALEYYKFEATLTSTNNDDDSIGLVIAFVRDNGVNKALVAHRTHSGTAPNLGWGIAYYEGGVQTTLTNVSVGGTSSGWNGSASRVKVERNGDLIRTWATPWNDLANFQGEMVIDLEANTINGAAVAVDLSVFKGKKQYGYYTFSQADSTYQNVVFEGGVARDVAILLVLGVDTDDDGRDDTWSDSGVWRFQEGEWVLVPGRKIQDELGYPRVVTSVAPYPAPDGEPSGTRYEVREGVVVLVPSN